MLLYHGSSIGGIAELKPILSEHKKPYVYLTSNPMVALLYAVKPVPKPFSFYPYGFRDDKVVYSEYYPNCFHELYQGKTGYLYECETPQQLSNPTPIPCAYTCEMSVKVKNFIRIDDLYEKLMEYSATGLFEIKPYDHVAQKELNYVYADLRKTIEQYHLKHCPENPMSQFIMTHFPQIWAE